MTVADDLNAFKAAARILTWLGATGRLTLPIDLDLVRQMLPDTPLGRGSTIKEPADLTWNASEGALVRNPENENEWGIFVNPKARPERRRFTIAHELGHFILHRTSQPKFLCDKESVYSGIDNLKQIEREADDFASNLLMPGDMLRDRIAGRRIDFHLIGELAKEFGVSLESMSIRIVKYSEQRAILLYWDNGFLKYEWRSKSAVMTRARIRRPSDPLEPLLGSLAANINVEQEWDGVELSASLWCAEEAQHMKLREFKHSYGAHNRVLTLLLLEAAEPRSWDRSWQEADSFDSFDQFISNGQPPIR